MAKVVRMQSMDTSGLDRSKLCSFDLEVIDAPTAPLIHQSARFLLINGGQGTIRIQNVEYALGPGAFVSILPWEISEVIEVASPLQYYLLVYRFDTVNQIIKSFYNQENTPVDIVRVMTATPVVACDKSQYEKVSSVLLSIRDEVGIESTMAEVTEKTMGGIFITNQLVELVVLYMRIGAKNNVTFGNTRLAIDRTELFGYMYNHLNEKLTLKMLSRLFYMSESSISQYITQVTGLSFFDLLAEMRVGKTVNFLLYTDLTLDELAEIIGYVDASHISKVFSARIGMKAGDYRKTYQRVSEICKVKESKKAYAIVEFIYRGYAEPLTAQKVADHFAMGVRELHRTLLYQVEKNFEEFLNFVRISRACALLLQTDKTVLEIALEVGYNSTKTFTRNFLKLQVMTPGEFRKRVTLQSAFE